MPSTEVMLLRLLLAILVGGIIGAEREYVSKAAGFRTIILICMGSCLFTMFSILINEEHRDRIASNIVTGIGFLGAGVIFQEQNRVRGLTTAATVWATAALGMGIGAGYYWIPLIGSILVLFALYFLTYLEEYIDRINQTRNYRVVCHYEIDHLFRIENLFREHQLKYKRSKQSRIKEDITGTWMVSGSEKNHQKFIKTILQDETVKEFDF